MRFYGGRRLQCQFFVVIIHWLISYNSMPQVFYSLLTPLCKTRIAVFSLFQFSALYLLSFFVILLGLVIYSSSSTYIAQDPRVYKQFRNAGNPVPDMPNAGPLEPSVTYSSLGQEIEDEPRVRVA